MAAITTAVVGAGVGLYSASQSSKAQKQANNINRDAAAHQAEIADRQQAISEEQYQRYKDTFQPLEDQFVNEARGLGSLANQEQAATEARGEVAGAYGRARDQLNQTPGANPASQAYLQEASRINLSEAATSAASQTAARRNQVDKGRAAAADALNIGKGLPASASSSLAAASSTSAAAGSMAAQHAAGLVSQANHQAQGLNSFGQMVGGLVNNKTVQDMGSSLMTWLKS